MDVPTTTTKVVVMVVCVSVVRAGGGGVGVIDTLVRRRACYSGERRLFGRGRRGDEDSGGGDGAGADKHLVGLVLCVACVGEWDGREGGRRGGVRARYFCLYGRTQNAAPRVCLPLCPCPRRDKHILTHSGLCHVQAEQTRCIWATSEAAAGKPAGNFPCLLLLPSGHTSSRLTMLAHTHILNRDAGARARCW